MKTKINVKVNEISSSWVKTAAVYVTAGALFAKGSFIFSSKPFAVALSSASGGITAAVSSVIGGMLGSFGTDGGLVFAAILPLIFFARLIIGRWLSEPESREELSAYESSPLPIKLIVHLRRFAAEGAELAFAESVYIRMILSSLTAMIAGTLLCITGGYKLSDTMSAVAGALTAPALVYLYTCALDEKREDSDMLKEAGRIALAASLVVSLHGIIPLFDAAVPAAFMIVILATGQRGILIGTVYGVVCGVVLTPEFAPLYAIAAIVAGCLWKVSPAIAVTGACTAGILWGMYVSGLSAMSTVTPSLIITSAVLAPLCAAGILPKGGNKSLQMYNNTAGEKSVAYMLKGRDTSGKILSLSESISDISKVLYRLSGKLTAPDTEELCEICERAFEEHCKNCGMKNACFGREAESTAELQAKMTMQLKKDGHVSAAVVPNSLARRCYNMSSIIDSMNAGCIKRISEAKIYDRTSVVAADYEVMADMLRESAEYDEAEYICDREMTDRLKSRLRSENFAAESIAVFGDRIKKVVVTGVSVGATTAGADDIRSMFSEAAGTALSDPEFSLEGSSVMMKLHSLARLNVRCGRASVAMSELDSMGIKRKDFEYSGNRNESRDDAEDHQTRIFSPEIRKSGIGKTASEDSGDVINAFMTEDKRFFMMISDGMGSGKEAAMTSGVCAVFLEKMLKSGASMDTALKMLNSMMRVREGECSATIDLMELDLMNGNTKFVKSGAAPSFVLRSGRLFRLQSKTVPIGIVRALDAEMIRFEAQAGDIVVMLSDGIVHSFEDCPWLYDMLCDRSEWLPDPEKMAKKIIRHAIMNGAHDDITAGIVMIS